MIYRALFNLVLRRVDAERAHLLVAWLVGRLAAIPFVGRLLSAVCRPDPVLRAEALGRTFPSPLGVAAGLDKDATWFGALGDLGFGFVEIGTVTAEGQPGNPRPRITRLPAYRALRNSMGFPNSGAVEVADRLSRRGSEPVVGVNVGKTKRVDLEAAADDYRASVRLLAAHADYLVLNVSSPNTPGLRSMQSAYKLRPLITAVQEELRELAIDLPVLVKISPDLANEQIDELAALAVDLGLAGIVATNTTTDGRVLGNGALAEGEGGISGPPLAARSLEVLRRLHATVGDRLTLISVGGIESVDDVWERLLAGATLVQVYTGFVYGGPLWPRRVNRELARRVGAAGETSIQPLIGRDGRP